MEMEKAHNWTDFDKLTTVPYNKHRKFVGVEYPGIIKNPEKALKTLGGIDNLEKVLYSQLIVYIIRKFIGHSKYIKPDDILKIYP